MAIEDVEPWLLAVPGQILGHRPCRASKEQIPDDSGDDPRCAEEVGFERSGFSLLRQIAVVLIVVDRLGFGELLQSRPTLKKFAKNS